MKTIAPLLALTFLLAVPADAHKIKRNCLWAGQNIFRTHIMCSDGNSQPRAAPSRSETPSPPDEPSKPNCKDDDKDDDKDDKRDN